MSRRALFLPAILCCVAAQARAEIDAPRYYQPPKTLLSALRNLKIYDPADPTYRLTNGLAPPPFTWQGFHVGVNFGGGFTGASSPWGVGTAGEFRSNGGWILPPQSSGGVLGGVQAGYDYPIGKVVLGAEVDWQAAGVSGGSTSYGFSSDPLARIVNRRPVDWFGTLRGRIGYSLAPTLLAYGTGGFAYGGGGASFRYRDSSGAEAESLVNPTRTGFAAGGGVEWSFLPNWSVKGEYLYVDLGKSPGHRAVQETESEGEEPEGPKNIATLTGYGNRFSLFRMGLNYRFNFLHTDDPLYGNSELFLARDGEKSPEISSHYLFGFTYGTDIETEGRGELLNITRVNVGKRARAADYHYSTIESAQEFEHTITEDFQYAVGVIGSHQNIQGVVGLPNLHNTSLGGVLGEARYILARRSEARPIGVSLHVEPKWGHVSSVSGLPEVSFESDNRLCLDAELLPKRLFAAVNLMYTPQIFREFGESKWVYAAYSGAMGGMTYFATPKIGLGGGLQYFRRHDQDIPNIRASGDALYIGPQVYLRLTNQLFLTAAFSRQVTGHSRGDNRPLDLVNFTRDMARIQFGGEF